MRLLNQRLPSYPIFVNDPYFSLWSDTDKINEKELVFWHGETKPVYGIIELADKVYLFMGKKPDAIALQQTSVELKAFSTIYRFTCDAFDFAVEFISPLLPTNPDLASRPVCYLTYTLTPKRKIAKANIQLWVEERVVYNTSYNENERKKVRAGELKLEKYETAYMGLRYQTPLSHSMDEVGADWGWYYVAGAHAFTSVCNERQFIVAENIHINAEKEEKGTLLLAFDDSCSIVYYGDWLKGYYFRNGKTIIDALTEAYETEQATKTACEEFDNDLIERTKAYGDDYLFVLYASLRQTMGAHKIVETKDKRLLFLSKECNSDGCIATVDVSYPTFPLLYLYNKDLLKGMLYPVFEFARKPIWTDDFAPHDVGIYPYCVGQLYAAKGGLGSDYCLWGDNELETLPNYYLFPAGTNVYNPDKQMPVEECANMIILTALTEDIALMRENKDLLKKWSKYLIDNGLIPESQLCTDDFAGHLAKNANLAIKAIIGIKAYASILEKLGDKDSATYLQTAKEYTAQWLALYVKDGKSVLALDLPDDSYSLKYNLAVDALLGEPLFTDEFKEKEVDYYLTKANRYGIPLDTRKTYTKSDWLLWTATLTKDLEKRKTIIRMLVYYLTETEDRVPFSDWYYADTAKYSLFRNRSVQGGLFMPLLQNASIKA